MTASASIRVALDVGFSPKVPDAAVELTITITTSDFGPDTFIRATINGGTPEVFPCPGGFGQVGEITVFDGDEVLLEALDEDLLPFCATGSTYGFTPFPWDPVQTLGPTCAANSSGSTTIPVIEGDFVGTTGNANFNPAD